MHVITWSENNRSCSCLAPLFGNSAGIEHHGMVYVSSNELLNKPDDIGAAMLMMEQVFSSCLHV